MQNKHILTYIILAVAMCSCSGSEDSPVDPPFVKIDNRMHLTKVTIADNDAPQASYDFGMFIMKNIPENRRGYVPDRSFYYNVHAQVKVSNQGNVVSETFRKSTDTAYIDTLKLAERAYVYSYAPFISTNEEPSNSSFSYFGSRIPFTVHGGLDILVGKGYTELNADELSNQDLQCQLNLEHALTQFLFYVSNNTDTDTLTIFRMNLYAQGTTLRNEIYLNAFTGEIEINDSRSVSKMTTNISPGITLLPHQTSPQQIAMIIPNIEITNENYGCLSISLEAIRNGNVDSTYNTDTLRLPVYKYERNHAYEMVASIIRNKPIDYTTNWSILNWKNDTPTTNNEGLHYQNNAYINIAPWVNLQYTTEYHAYNPNPTVIIGTGEWAHENTGSDGSGKSEVATISMQLQSWEVHNDANSSYNSSLNSYYKFSPWSAEGMTPGDSYTLPTTNMNIHDWNTDSPTSETINKR